jgi:hypothetical protein
MLVAKSICRAVFDSIEQLLGPLAVSKTGPHWLKVRLPAGADIEATAVPEVKLIPLARPVMLLAAVVEENIPALPVFAVALKDPTLKEILPAAAFPANNPAVEVTSPPPVIVKLPDEKVMLPPPDNLPVKSPLKVFAAAPALKLEFPKNLQVISPP